MYTDGFWITSNQDYGTKYRNKFFARCDYKSKIGPQTRGLIRIPERYIIEFTREYGEIGLSPAIRRCRRWPTGFT